MKTWICNTLCNFYAPLLGTARLNAFAQSVGHLSGPVAYGQVVAMRCRPLWTGG